MPYLYRNRPVKLTPYPSYAESEVEIDECPNCRDTRISKTPRRKGGPSNFQCNNCGFRSSYDQLARAHWMLGHVAV